MDRPDKGSLHATMGRLVRSYTARRRPDKMDRIVQEARDEHLLHGKVGRTILGGYEGHRQSVWMQRAATAMIAGIVVGVICVLINLPLPVSLGIFGVFVLVAVACMGIGIVHLVRWWGIAYGPPLPDRPDTPAALENHMGKGNSDTQDADEGK